MNCDVYLNYLFMLNGFGWIFKRIFYMCKYYYVILNNLFVLNGFRLNLI